jgi:hypothetical protein
MLHFLARSIEPQWQHVRLSDPLFDSAENSGGKQLSLRQQLREEMICVNYTGKSACSARQRDGNRCFPFVVVLYRRSPEMKTTNRFSKRRHIETWHFSKA